MSDPSWSPFSLSSLSSETVAFRLLAFAPGDQSRGDGRGIWIISILSSIGAAGKGEKRSDARSDLSPEVAEPQPASGSAARTLLRDESHDRRDVPIMTLREPQVDPNGPGARGRRAGLGVWTLYGLVYRLLTRAPGGGPGGDIPPYGRPPDSRVSHYYSYSCRRGSTRSMAGSGPMFICLLLSGGAEQQREREMDERIGRE
jgi:hypothetical protein